MIKLKPSKPAWEHRGFILLPVVFALALLAAIAYLLNRQSAINTGNVNREHQLDAALYTAQAGYNHALWQLNTKNCSGYTAIPTTSLGQNSYSASFTDAAGTTSTSGSPININVTASKPDGSSYTINRYREKVYQYPTSTLVLQPNAAIGKDTMLYQLKPTLNYGAVDKLSVSAFGANPWQALLSFDLTKLSKNHRIVSAKLELYQTYVGAGAGDVGVHKMLAAWAEGSQSPGSVGPGANWNEADTGMAWSKPGGDYAALPVATFKPNIGVGWNQWDITSLVADWVSGGSTNNGLMLRPEDTNSDAYYASSDHTDALLRPKLTINYACECGQTCTPPVTFCEADYIPVNKLMEPSWNGGASDIWDIAYLPAGTVIKGIKIPESGGWVMIDKANKRFFVTDVAGAAQIDFPTPNGNPVGVSFISKGSWQNHLAVSDSGNMAIYFVDMIGNSQGSISVGGITQNPLGLAFIETSISGIYDDNLVIASDKDNTGSSIGQIYIVNQAGVLQTSININALTPEPYSVTHLPGTDKLLVVAKTNEVFIIGFDGTVYNQYSGSTFGLSALQGVTIDPLNCNHVIISKDTKTVGVLGGTPPPTE